MKRARPARVRLHAPAKLNLTLQVGGRRPDGFHAIDTLMMAIDLADVLEVDGLADGLTLEVRGPARAGVPDDSSNLALRAAEIVRALARARGLEVGGARIVLEKHVPAQAGLGGGSSDAASAALACARIWGLDADDPELGARLGELGSDCAFFLDARATGLARCAGRGERVEPLARLDRPWSVALLTPSFGCSTAEVYRAHAASGQAPVARRHDPSAFRTLPLADVRASLFNDLESAAARVQPELAPLRARLEAGWPGVFRLAGSGSSLFGFFADERSARAAIEDLVGSHEGRRFALRGQWVLPMRSHAIEALNSKAH